MGKFILECPKCGAINHASTSIFAKKVIECGVCKQSIQVKEARFAPKTCPHCSKSFVCDLGKGRKHTCPACGKEMDAISSKNASCTLASVRCPKCASTVEVDSSKPLQPCPLCGEIIKVEQTVAKKTAASGDEKPVIRYDGASAYLVWKHPLEDFPYGTQLIVHESQQALFFLNGQALDLFGPGRHILETEKLPLVKKALASSAEQPYFHAEIYFINMATAMGLKWGVDSRIRFVDPKTGIPLDIGASGEIRLQVSDARKLVLKLVGTADKLRNGDCVSFVEPGSPCRLGASFRAPLLTAVKSYLSSVIGDCNLNIFEIDSKMEILSEALRVRVAPYFEEYGITVPEMFVTSISLPEDDANFKSIKQMFSDAYLGVRAEQIKASVAEASREHQIIEEQTKAQLAAIRAQSEADTHRTVGLAEAEVMAAKGYNGKDVLDAKTQKAFAYGAKGASVSDALSDLEAVKTAITGAEGWSCECGYKGNQGKFCQECGKAKPTL